MREPLVKLRTSRISGQEGWVMMDAVWSSVVVILAFMATFMALENGTKTATRDISKTTAYDIAQNELSGLRDLGKSNLNALLAKNNTNAPPNNPSKTVTLNGDDYQVWYSAYYVTGLGNNSTDACGGSYASNGNGTAKFIYIKVKVAYQGITFTGSTPSSPLPTLDEYWAPEGGDTNAATGTLRVYLLKPPSDVPWSGVGVSLTGPGNFATQTATTGSNGCVLFTGLPRGAFNIAVTTSKFDIYLNNPNAAGILNVPIVLPDRAAMQKDIRMDSPVKVPFETWVHGVQTGDQLVTPPPTNVPTGVGASSLVGPWQALSNKILNIPTNHPAPTEFATAPGTAFMPHGTWLPTYATNYLYPDPAGYDVFPGPCDVNKVATQHVPASGNTTFTAGGTYQESSANPVFWLPELNIQVQGDRNDETAAVGNYRFKQYRKFNSTTPNYGAKVQVKLINGPGTGHTAATSAMCGPNAALFNTWIRLKGNMYSPLTTAAAPYNVPVPRLEDSALTVPPGTYDVCVDAYVEAQQYRRTNATSPATYGWVTVTEHRYYDKIYDTGTAGTDAINWDPFHDTALTANTPLTDPNATTTACGNSALWTP